MSAFALSQPPPVPLRSRRIAGKYQPLEVAGRGGMSIVWRAIQHGPGRFRRPVALKHMNPALASQPMYRAMFFEEARIGAVLQDPNLAQIYDFLIEDDELYLVMEWIEGIDLYTYVDYVTKFEERETRWDLMVGLTIGMLRGLAAAHERTTEDGTHEPIIHRDVTPHNVLLSDKGPVKLIDFGLSLATDRHGESTEPGVAKGKVSYVAPEVVMGERPTPRSDLFAAGAVLWEALVGRRLFEHPDRIQLLKKIALGEVEPLNRHRPDLPGELVDIVHRALAIDPADRFASARDMAYHLGAVLKTAISDDDLYATLAREVREGREALELGHRTQGQSYETPVPEDSSALIELAEDDLEPVAETAATPA